MFVIPYRSPVFVIVLIRGIMLILLKGVHEMKIKFVLFERTL